VTVLKHCRSPPAEYLLSADCEFAADDAHRSSSSGLWRPRSGPCPSGSPAAGTAAVRRNRWFRGRRGCRW